MKLLSEVAAPKFRGLMVYFIQAENGSVKIGRTKNLRQRLVDLQAMSPLRLRLVAWSTARPGYESFLHYRFAGARLHGEWFRPESDLLALAGSIGAAGELRHKTLRAFLEQPSDQNLHAVASPVFHPHAPSTLQRRTADASGK